MNKIPLTQMISKYRLQVGNSGTYRVLELFIPVRPVPASRPRISKFGSYYTKSYTEFRKQVYSHLKQLKNKFQNTKAMFEIDMEIICYKPNKPSNEYPRGDNDNYEKGYYDSITYAQVAWEDDIQIVKNLTHKRYQKKGEPYGARITIKQLKSTSSDNASS